MVRSGIGLGIQSDVLVPPRQRKQTATFIGSSAPPLTDVIVKFTASPRGCQMVPRDDDGRSLSATRRTWLPRGGTLGMSPAQSGSGNEPPPLAWACLSPWSWLLAWSFVFPRSVVPAAVAGEGVVTGGAGGLSAAVAKPGHVKNSANRPSFTWHNRNASLQNMLPPIIFLGPSISTTCRGVVNLGVCRIGKIVTAPSFSAGD